MSSIVPEQPENHEQPAESQRPGEASYADLDIGRKVDHFLKALVIPGSNPVHELQELDGVYAQFAKENAAGAAAFVTTTAMRLFQQSDAFDNLNFHSSLLENGSDFFGLVLRRMGDLIDEHPEYAEGAKLPVLIRLVEHHRRGKQEDQMRIFAAKVRGQLQDAIAKNDPLALRQVAKVLYEESMFASDHGDQDEATKLAEESAALCEEAGDEYGVLAARGNIDGLFVYRKTDALLAQEQPELEEVAQEFLAKGIPELETDVQKGLQMMKNAQEGTPLWKNTNRAVFNDLVHLVEMAKRRNDLGLAQRSMELLGENSLYKTYPADNPYTKILATLEGTQKQEPHGLEGDQNEEPHGLETTQKQELSEKKDRPGFFGYIGKKIGSVVRWLRSRF